MPGTRKLGRVSAHRNAMLRGMVTYLLENGSIETTLTRAKEVRCMTEKMITLGKKNTLASRRAALAYITKEDVVKKLFDVIAPEYADRSGGYTRIYKLGPRRGDGAEMALIKLVAEEKTTAELNKKSKAPKKAAAKKAPKAEKAEQAKEVAAEPEIVAEVPAEEKTEAEQKCPTGLRENRSPVFCANYPIPNKNIRKKSGKRIAFFPFFLYTEIAGIIILSRRNSI